MSHEMSAGASAAAAGFSAHRLERIGAVLRADVQSGAIPGAVVSIVRDGSVACFEAFGYADRQTQTPMQRDSVFRIASMTKPLTTVAALLLMERGQLLLTDPVWRHLPILRDVTVGVEDTDASGSRRLKTAACRRAMTVYDLMRHTAGFTYGQFGDSLVQRAYRAANVMDTEQTNDEMLAKLAQLPLAYQPGTTFEYGMSTDVLGALVEVVSGMDLDQFFAAHILGPLGMRDTAFEVDPAQAHRLAAPHRSGGSGTATTYDPFRPRKWFSGGGGLVSTASDYSRFCQMLLNHGELDGVRILGRKTLELMLQNHLPSTLAYGQQTAELGVAAPLPTQGQGYGLGVGVRLGVGLSPVPGSPGDICWGGSLGPYFWIDPTERLSAVFMLQEMNVQVRTRYRALMRALVYQAIE